MHGQDLDPDDSLGAREKSCTRKAAVLEDLES